MDIKTALDFVAKNATGVFTAIGSDGFPHSTVVSAAVIEDRLWISATQTRAKTRLVRANPNVTFLAGLGPWAAIQGTARIDEGDGLAERLRAYYRAVRGEHPDWDDYDRAMVEDERLLIDVTPVRALGMGL
jgi:PPOX class probable F420-dependent enzyme